MDNTHSQITFNENEITNEKKELTTTVSTSTKSTTTSTPSSISLFSKLLLPKQDCVSKLVLVPPRESDNPCRVPKSKPIVITSSISVDNNPFNTNTSVSRWSSRSLDDDAFGSRSETVDCQNGFQKSLDSGTSGIRFDYVKACIRDGSLQVANEHLNT